MTLVARTLPRRAQAIRSRLWLLLALTPAGCSATTTCEDGEPNAKTGLVDCGVENIAHRPEAITCEAVDDTDPNLACVKDADCPGENAACLCGEGGGVCVQAYCKTDADCDEDQFCATMGDIPGFACTTANDECLVDSDCDDGDPCVFDGDRRICDGTEYVDGRPFLVDDEARVAPPAPRADWRLDLLTPALDHLGTAESARRGARWLRAAQLEHGSIAAFARFALQLLSLGAPPSLVEATHVAMADETRHARSAFALASAYLGRDVGPGPLEIEGALTASSVEDILRLTIREGCFGEMEAALQADQEAAASDDPIVRDVLVGVAQDELRHAELAFSTVAWLVRSHPELTRVVREEIAAADAGSLELLDAGLDAEASRAVRDTARRQIALPCLRALCEQAAPRPHHPTVVVATARA